MSYFLCVQGDYIRKSDIEAVSDQQESIVPTKVMFKIQVNGQLWAYSFDNLKELHEVRTKLLKSIEII